MWFEAAEGPRGVPTWDVRRLEVTDRAIGLVQGVLGGAALGLVAGGASGFGMAAVQLAGGEREPEGAEVVGTAVGVAVLATFAVIGIAKGQRRRYEIR